MVDASRRYFFIQVAAVRPTRLSLHPALLRVSCGTEASLPARSPSAPDRLKALLVLCPKLLSDGLNALFMLCPKLLARCDLLDFLYSRACSSRRFGKV